MRTLSVTNAISGWVLILLFAIGNGALREALLMPALGAVAGMVISGLLLIAAVWLVSYLLLWVRPARLPVHGLWLGIGWLVATLAFEFGFGMVVQGKVLAELLAAYSFAGGNLWPLVLLSVLIAPYLVARWQGGRHDKSA